MTLQTAMLVALIIVLGVAQYALCVQAVRDLVRRPRVRGENKVLWGLGILCLPIGGAILYNWMGPTSFIHRPLVTNAPAHKDGRQSADKPSLSTNITPISAARSARRMTKTARADTASTRRAASHPNNDRTGS